jgi:hypothetical protein
MSKRLERQVLAAIVPVIEQFVADARKQELAAATAELRAARATLKATLAAREADRKLLDAAAEVAAACNDVEAARYTRGEIAARMGLERKAKLLRAALNQAGGHDGR